MTTPSSPTTHEQGANPTMSFRECIADILNVATSRTLSVEQCLEGALSVANRLDILGLDLDDSEPDPCQWEKTSVLHDICSYLDLRAKTLHEQLRFERPDLQVCCISIVRKETMANNVPQRPFQLNYKAEGYAISMAQSSKAHQRVPGSPNSHLTRFQDLIVERKSKVCAIKALLVCGFCQQFEHNNELESDRV